MDPENTQTTPPAPITAETIPVQPTPVPVQSIQSISPTKKSKLPLVLGMIILLVAVGSLGILAGKYLFGSKTPETAKPIVTVTTSTPTPTVDPTANWKTYTNTKNKYSFKYSEYFKYLAENPDGGVYLAPSEGTGEGKGSPFGLDPNKDSWISASATNLDSAGLTYWKNYLANQKSNITISGISGYKNQVLPKEASEVVYGFEVTILKDNILYKLGLDAGSEKLGLSTNNQALFDQILSTFRFD